jgi:hypothetical protein
MPLRAFLLFLHVHADKFGKVDCSWAKSQCPSGHFCYFYRQYKYAVATFQFTVSQCPSGHFCYFYVEYISTALQNGDRFDDSLEPSQCPSGHFCYFYTCRL